MDTNELNRRAHELDVTVWVGKGGIDSVVDELNDQLSRRDLVKVKFLRAARAGGSTDDKAAALADAVSGELIETRGHTAVLYR